MQAVLESGAGDCGLCPLEAPSGAPSGIPSLAPSGAPSGDSSGAPSGDSSGVPSRIATRAPSIQPSGLPITETPSLLPTGVEPTESPTGALDQCEEPPPICDEGKVTFCIVIGDEQSEQCVPIENVQLLLDLGRSHK